jgi:[ribosomal protein S18]-alanine N-acetyltransferase
MNRHVAASQPSGISARVPRLGGVSAKTRAFVRWFSVHGRPAPTVVLLPRCRDLAARLSFTAPGASEGKAMAANASSEVYVRWWAWSKDKARILEIEQHSFDTPWDAGTFEAALSRKTIVALVAERSGRIAGYCLYELHPDRMDVINLAVAPECRRRGVASAMINRMKAKLSREKRAILQVTISERNLVCQVFLRALGFRCVATLRDYFRDSRDDAYAFEFRANEVQLLHRRETLCSGK